ncbi:MAG: prepilin-type N-terminal cleavage/methylation domain-containing protein [Gemmatimonadota bacterium]
MSKRRPADITLIELLIVVVIIGILVAIAINKFGNTRKSANQAARKSDLRNLMTAQEQYFGDAKFVRHADRRADDEHPLGPVAGCDCHERDGRVRSVLGGPDQGHRDLHADVRRDADGDDERQPGLQLIGSQR